MKKYSRLVAFLLLFVSASLFSACGEEEAAIKINVIKVNAFAVEKKEMPYGIEYPGTVEGEIKVKLSTKLMGEITYFPFEAGSKVNKNQLLAKINSGDVEAKYQQVKANVLQARSAFTNVEINYNRVKDLFHNGSATKKEMEDIQLAYDMAKAQLSSANEMENEIVNVLSYSEIRAPFDGYIINKFFEVGDITAPGHPIMIVENFNSFNVAANIPASNINNFTIGHNVSIKIDAVGKKEFDGKIIEINPGGNSYSKQFEIKVSITNKNNSEIKPGMFASVSQKDLTKPMVTIDEKFLVKRGQLFGVYSITENKEAILRWIRLGKKINGRYEVLSGLNEGDLIIVDKEKVKEGQRVEVI